MRKIFALAMVVVLSMTVAFAIVSCGKKAEESTPPPAEQASGAMSDSGMAHSDSGMTAAPAESTAKKK